MSAFHMAKRDLKALALDVVTLPWHLITDYAEYKDEPLLPRWSERHQTRTLAREQPTPSL